MDNCIPAEESLKKLAQQYTFAEYSSAGQTLLGRDIPLLCIGEGEKNILLLGGADAAEGVSENILLQFAKELCEQIARGSLVFRINCSYLAKHRRIWILPRLNPDGRSLVLSGADPSSPLYERQLKQNGMKSDFSAWQGNARGVHPGLNFGQGFSERKDRLLKEQPTGTPLCGEFPESEPESAVLTRLIRLLTPSCLVEFGTGCGEIFYPDPACLDAANEVARLTRYALATEPAIGPCAHFTALLARPSLFLACAQDVFRRSPAACYGTLREFLFRLPSFLGI